MKQYKVFKHPSGSTEAVKQGWSWPGFFFNFIWALVKKMWALGVGVLISFLVFGFFIGFASVRSSGDAIINFVALIANIIFGINGNSWREKNLVSRGFEKVDTVTAANPESAIALHLKRYATALSNKSEISSKEIPGKQTTGHQIEEINKISIRDELIEQGCSKDAIDYLNYPIHIYSYMQKYKKTEDKIHDAIKNGKLRGCYVGEALWVEDKKI